MNSVCEIPLTQGKVAIVDEQDYQQLSAYHWCAEKSKNTWYAARGTLKNYIPKSYRMHREIMGNPTGVQIDHVNGNGLDNRRCNLRLCDYVQNGQNARIRSDTSSKYKGVYWHKKYQKWISRIKTPDRYIYIGAFKNEIDAAKAYDQKATEYFGNFARTNF